MMHERLFLDQQPYLQPQAARNEAYPGLSPGDLSAGNSLGIKALSPR